MFLTHWHTISLRVSEPSVIVHCDHCGDPCGVPVASEGNLLFCCYGCKAVHELLSGTPLSHHFATTSRQNTSLSYLQAEKKYSFLDHPDIVSDLLTFREERLAVVKFFLSGIHCSSCIYLLEHLPTINKAIYRSEVNFVKKQLTLTYDPESITLKDLAILLAQLGYTPDISLDQVGRHGESQKRPASPTARIAVAGFCFGNAMLMSFPEYLDIHLEMEESFRVLFRWINLFLGVPVLFYAGWDYLKSAVIGIQHRHLTIDLPIALGMVTLFGRSTYEIVSMTGAGYMDSLSGLVFLLLVGKWYQNKTYQALSFERDYSSYFPVSIQRMVKGKEVATPLKELQKGDVVLIHNDEILPADAVLLDEQTAMDYSFISGEQSPVIKHKGDALFAGGRQKGVQIKCRLTRNVATSELTQLWNQEVFRKTYRPMQTAIDGISSYFTAIILILAVGNALYWQWYAPEMVWLSTTAVLIVACPCALALSLPFAYGHAMRLLGRSGWYLKNADVVEQLSDVSSLVFDKTGTLTRNESERVTFEGKQPLDEDQWRLLKTGLANSAHPLSRVILTHAPASLEKLPIQRFKEHTGSGFEAWIHDRSIKVGAAKWVGQTHATPSSSESQVHVAIEGDYLGYFRCPSTYRRDVFTMLQSLKRNYNTHLLSGDKPAEKERLAPYFESLYFEQKPMDKLAFVRNSKDKMLMVGDGLNDAGALKQAHCGIAVSENIHQFSPSCDAIVTAEKLNQLPSILRFTKDVKRIVYVAFGLSFLYNAVGLSFAMSGQLTPLVSAILMPVSSVTVVAFVTGSVSWRSQKIIK